MKSQETKNEFIRLRAEGRSFSYIAKELQLSKSTCSEWERELKDAIAELKRDSLTELYNSYYMTKEARIRKLGETLEGINTALDGADLNEVPAEKLLDFKLKYTDALKEEYVGSGQAYKFSDHIDATDIVNALADLLNRIRAGEITSEQAQKESLVLSNLLRAYDTVEVKQKLEALEAIVGNR